MAKASKNQRADRRQRDASTPMAKVVVAEKKENGEYRYRERMVPQSEVQDVLKEARG